MLDSLMTWINDISQGNQMIAGAVTLALSGSAAYLVKQLPQQVGKLIKAQFITTLTFNNSSFEKQQTFMKVSQFLSELTSEAGSRTLILDSCWINGKDVMGLTMGYGKHFFFYKGKFLWLDRGTLESSGSERLKEQITISVLGRSHDIFKELLEDNKPKRDTSKINFNEYKDEDKRWVVKGKISKQPLDELALDTYVKKMFTDEVDYFKANKDAYKRLGLPYKMSWVLHGVPGSGKSSIIRSIASEYDMNICNLPLSGMSDKSFREAVMEAPDNSLVVIEDFDSCSAVNKRTNVSGFAEEEKDKYEDGTSLNALSFLTLSGILNTLDGVASLDNKIIVFTTNCLDSVDPAMLRSGRIDKIIELPYISSKAVKSHFERIYNIKINFTCPELSAKDVNAIVFESKDDSDKAIQLLKDKRKGNEMQ